MVVDFDAYPPEAPLSDAERDDLLEHIAVDGYAVLPHKLPGWMADAAERELGHLCAEELERNPDRKKIGTRNLVDKAPIFRRMMMFKPALQLAYDVFGPMFHVGQSRLKVSLRGDPAINWHSDGPVNLPQVEGRNGLHTLRFGYYLSDLIDEASGSLEVIRGSHLAPALHGKDSIKFREQFRPEDFGEDYVQLRVKRGTVAVINQAIYHRAEDNQTDHIRKALYIQYCPAWMYPLDRHEPTEESLAGAGAVERYLLGEKREPERRIQSAQADYERMKAYAREEKQ